MASQPRYCNAACIFSLSLECAWEDLLKSMLPRLDIVQRCKPAKVLIKQEEFARILEVYGPFLLSIAEPLGYVGELDRRDARRFDAVLERRRRQRSHNDV